MDSVSGLAFPIGAGNVPLGRLDGKVVLVTGAAGNIGRDLCARLAREGATLVLLGRTMRKLEDVCASLREAGVEDGRLLCVAADAARPAEARRAIAEAVGRFGRIDVLVNNAGSTGPRQPIERIPFDDAELAALAQAGGDDVETAGAGARNLLGIAWNLVRAALPHMPPGGSIVNVSTIFSRTQYYGRAAYTVPKAALNALSRQLASETGPRGIRTNTVFPGPIESPRIHSVFSRMDALRSAASGTTAREFVDLMTLARSRDGRSPEPGFPSVADVAGTIAFLASDDSAALNGHNFEVTHGMSVRQESRSTFVSRPGLRIVDGTGRAVLVAAGDQVADALAYARIQAGCGADVILGFSADASVRDAQAALDFAHDPRDRRIRVVHFDRTKPESLARAFGQTSRPLAGAVILPAFGAQRFAATLATASDDDVDAFIDGEICGALAIARELWRFWKDRAAAPGPPRVVFVSNPDDGRGNVYADVIRASIEELSRVWRDEAEVERAAGRRHFAEWCNQIVRWTNDEAESARFAGGWASKLIHTKRRIRQVNLYLPASIVEATGARGASFGATESLMGIHLGKVALVTGGSAGIGAETARLLAYSGAHVMIAARDEVKLLELRNGIVSELETLGYENAAFRVSVIANVDVGDERALKRAADETLKQYGRIDYLINNAGVAGAQQMVVDMPLDEWRYTLRANLISNFSLMEKLLPAMKSQGSGYVVNLSSYFGGEKFVAVPYPNRADYAVSKAGQRALVEEFARFVGPEIQLNAIAPGPVEGERVRGSGGKPGLYERRARLILESKRLNSLYAAAIAGIREGDADAAAFLQALVSNDAAKITADPDAPPRLRRFAGDLVPDERPASDGGSWSRHLIDAGIAAKLVDRLRRGGYLPPSADDAFAAAWTASVTPPAQPFYPPADVAREAERIRKDVLKLLHLNRMPTETEVALAVVYFLADRAISGETFHPSGGLQQERSVTERELFGRAKNERMEAMLGRTVWIVGEHPPTHIVKAAETYIDECKVGCVVVMTRTASTAAAVARALARHVEAGKVVTRVAGDDVEAAMDEALHAHGRPVAVLSMPYAPVPERIFGEGVGPQLDTEGFTAVCEEQLTHHFRVSRRASLLDEASLVLVAPEVPLASSRAAFAIANFVKTTLHAFTATLAVENERLVHEVPVNQINLTRRVQSEEPRNVGEVSEELERFARAVVLASAPLPHADDSRYRSRIYRGMAITV
jgi:malonyl-CoA reductase/3-hydroxypropionate dehydrogenase (NADP+)